LVEYSEKKPSAVSSVKSLRSILHRVVYKKDIEALLPVPSNGGWDHDSMSFLYTTRCNIDRRDFTELTAEGFFSQYSTKRPVILLNVVDNSKFRHLCQKELLLRDYGHLNIVLSTANTHSYEKMQVPFVTYIEEMMGPQKNQTGADTWYHFGNNDYAAFAPLFQHYQIPKEIITAHHTFSFGAGGSGSGVPFHTHGPVFAEVLYGQKRWFLKAPGESPKFDPDENMQDWVEKVYPEWKYDESLLECVLQHDEMLFLPPYWWHATLNIGQTVFMSTFV